MTRFGHNNHNSETNVREFWRFVLLGSFNHRWYLHSIQPMLHHMIRQLSVSSQTWYLGQQSCQSTARTTDKSGLDSWQERSSLSLLNSAQSSTLDHSASYQWIPVLSESVQWQDGAQHWTPPDIYTAQSLMQHRCILTWPVKMNYSGWTKDVEDVTLLSKLGITAVNERSKCLTNKSTNICLEKIKMDLAVYLHGFTSHIPATRNVTDKMARKWGETRHST